MKNKPVLKRLLSLLLTLSLIFGLTLTAAAATETIENEPVPPDENHVVPNLANTLGQSFTALKNSAVDSVEVYIIHHEQACEVKMDIYAADENDMPVGESLGTSAAVTIQSPWDVEVWTKFVFETPVEIAAGNKYFFKLTSDNFLYFAYSEDYYKAGMLFSNNQYHPFHDLVFRITTTVAAYDVVFDSAGGSAVETQSVDYGNKALEPEDPERYGYTFGGWYAGEGLYDFETPVTAPLTLTAKWTATTAAVSFDARGGTPAPADMNVTFGNPYGTLPGVTKAGYTFAGWYTCLSEGLLVTAETEVTVAGNHTLYAMWTVNSYTITFNSNGGSAVASVTAPYGSAVTAPANPTRAGYTFAGWSPAVPATMPIGGAALTAQWTAVAVAPEETVSFPQQPLPVSGSAAPVWMDATTPPVPASPVSDSLTPETEPSAEDASEGTADEAPVTVIAPAAEPEGGADTGDVPRALPISVLCAFGTAAAGLAIKLRRRATAKR